MTQLPTLPEWLLACIDDDEQRLILHQAGCRWVESDTFGECDCGGPARVLADCEAKRQVVRQVSKVEWCGYAVRDVVLSLLAVPYADRPGYRDEWRP